MVDGEKLVGPSGCHGDQRSTSLMDGQVAPLGLQVFPQETPTVEQAFWSKDNVMAAQSRLAMAVLGMHVWMKASTSRKWVGLKLVALSLQVFPR